MYLLCIFFRETSGSYPILLKNFSKYDRDHQSIELSRPTVVSETPLLQPSHHSLKGDLGALSNSDNFFDVCSRNRLPLYYFQKSFKTSH